MLSAERVPAAAPSPAVLRVQRAPQRRDALERLTECERLWAGDPQAALRCDGSPDSRHRRLLVLHALAAYDALRSAGIPSGEPLLVFRRWPACTVAALLGVAAAATDGATLLAGLTRAAPGAATERWLQAWSECWEGMFGGREPTRDEVPGLRLLLAAARPAVVVPELRLDVDRGALIVVLTGSERDGAVEAGAATCPPIDGGWLLPRPAPAALHRDVLGDVRRLHIVDPADPLLLFTEDGALLGADGPLRSGTSGWCTSAPHLRTPSRVSAGCWRRRDHPSAGPDGGWAGWRWAPVPRSGP